jgi:ribonuclease E
MARISKFGLLEMSRQRLAPPVQQGAFVACTSCLGTGIMRSLNYIVVHVLRKINEHLASGKVKKLRVEVSPDVIEYMLNKKVKFLLNLQEKLQFELEFISNTSISWVDFKYLVTEKTEGEIKNQESSATTVIGQAKINGGESSKQRYPGRRVSQSNRRTYENDKSSSIQSDKIKIESQSQTINDETKQKAENQAPKTPVRRSRPPQKSRYVRRNNGPRPDRKNIPRNTRINQPSSLKPPSQSSIVINTQSKISLDGTKIDSVSKGENKNLFKRMTGFFGKVIKSEETPPSGPKS